MFGFGNIKTQTLKVLVLDIKGIGNEEKSSNSTFYLHCYFYFTATDGENYCLA